MPLNAISVLMTYNCMSLALTPSALQAHTPSCQPNIPTGEEDRTELLLLLLPKSQQSPSQ